jgi:uncharacterized RDD family membrane protein YckC
MEWYYKDGDQEMGPVSKVELQNLINSRRVVAQTLVRSSQSNEWRPLADLVRRKPAAPPPPPPRGTPATAAAASVGSHTATAPSTVRIAVCSQCGRSLPQDQVVRFEGKAICGACKPMFVQKLKEGVGIGDALNYAGFWIRLGAKIIDGIILGIASWLVFIPLGMMMMSGEGKPGFGFLAVQQSLVLLIPALYATWFLGRFAATPGKMACGLRVVTAEAGQVSYARALGRHLSEYLSSLILAIGYIMAGFDSEKRALHDRICNTRVVRK